MGFLRMVSEQTPEKNENTHGPSLTRDEEKHYTQPKFFSLHLKPLPHNSVSSMITENVFILCYHIFPASKII